MPIPAFIDIFRSPLDREVIRCWTRPAEPASAVPYQLEFDPKPTGDSFEFLAVGDTGDSDGRVGGESPQDAVARAMAQDARLPGSRGAAEMVLHLGDVVYLSGEKRLYRRDFFEPYQPFLTPESTAENLIFRLPFLPVPGNHDYYDLSTWFGAAMWLPLFGKGVRALFRRAGRPLPKGGSKRGRAYMDAFVANGAGPVQPVTRYAPGQQTRVPNRYYTFRRGCVDFFALDSNTLEAKPSIPTPKEFRRENAQDKREASARAQEVVVQAATGALPPPVAAPEDEVSRPHPSPMEEFLDAQREVAQDTVRANYTPDDHDRDQLQWLSDALDRSERERPDAWRVVYMHHPPYTTITNHCEKADVRGVRENLLPLLRDRVHLVLAGHAHAFEWIRSRDLPNTALIVSGGGGMVGLRPSVVDTLCYRTYAERYDRVRDAGVIECAVAGVGPEALDGQDGGIYNYVLVQVTPQALYVRPVGIRRLANGRYRREEPMPVYHAPALPADPEWPIRSLHAVEIRKGIPPQPIFTER